jgi:hypothetical protein
MLRKGPQTLCFLAKIKMVLEIRIERSGTYTYTYTYDTML